MRQATDLKDLVADNPQQRANAESIEVLVKERLTHLRALYEAVLSGNVDQASLNTHVGAGGL